MSWELSVTDSDLDGGAVLVQPPPRPAWGAREAFGGRISRSTALVLIRSEARSEAREELGFKAQLSQWEETGWGTSELLRGHPCRAFEL